MASELKVDKFTGVTTAGSILVTGEGNSTTTNLQQGLVKVWIYTEADGQQINNSLNVSSLTDSSTGQQKVNINNNMGNSSSSGAMTFLDDGAGREFMTDMATDSYSQKCYKVASGSYHDIKMGSHLCGDLA
jgi:hypothetical protein